MNQNLISWDLVGVPIERGVGGYKLERIRNLLRIGSVTDFKIIQNSTDWLGIPSRNFSVCIKYFYIQIFVVCIVEKKVLLI